MGERSETAEVTIIQDEGEKDGRPETGGVPSERAEAILQVGGGSSTETSKLHGLRLALKDHQRENESLEKEDIQDGKDEALVARFFEGTIPIGEERRRDALKKMQVKARKAKEKKEQQKREMKASPQHAFPNLQNKPNKVAKSSEDQELTAEDRIRFWRNKSEEMLQAAIESCGEFDGVLFGAEHVQNIVWRLELAVYVSHPFVGNTYRKRVRTIVLNLRGNPELRTNLMTGVITPEELVSMSTEEMASSEVRKKREEAVKQGLVERVGSNTIYSTTRPTWQYLTDRQLDKEGDSRLGQSDNDVSGNV